jgi:MFS family permease
MNLTLIMMAGGAVAFGRLADTIGRRTVLLGGLVVSAAATIGCAVAPSIGILIGFRALQGIGFSAVLTASVTLAARAYPGDRQSAGLSRWFAASLLASIVGAPLIGSVCQFLSWRWVFWLDLPSLAVGFALVMLIEDEPSRSSVRRSFDWLGLSLLVTGFLLVSFGLQSANELGWTSLPVLSSLNAGVVLLLVFGCVQVRRPSPLIDLELFQSKHFLLATAVTFIASLAVGALIFLAPLYLEVGLSVTPSSVGLILIAFEGPAFVVALWGDMAALRFGPNLLMLAGMLFFTLGCVVMAMIQVTTGIAFIVMALLLAGCGRGNVIPGTAFAALGAVNRRVEGAASGVITQARFFGQAAGVAMGLVVFNTWAERRLNDILPGSTLTHAQVHDVHGLLSGSAAARRGISNDAPGIVGTLDHVVHTISVAGLKATGLVLALACICGVAIAVYDRWTRDNVKEPAAPQEEQPALIGQAAYSSISPTLP